MPLNAQKLATQLKEAPSTVEYFRALFRAAELTTNHSVEFRDEVPMRAVFFGGAFTPKFARVILDCPSSAKHFSTLRELRFVSTRINREQAAEFKLINPMMSIYWVSRDQWLNREPGAPDPVGLEESLERMGYKPI